MFKQVEIIINPASGHDEPILNPLNDALRDVDIERHISVTQPDRNATYYTQAALDRGADLVIVYGGDGTIYEVAQVLIGTDVPLCILPGGTGNALATEFRLPSNIPEALHLALTPSPAILSIDTGLINDQLFVLNAGTGLYSRLMEISDRKMKDQYGWLAYVVAGVRSLEQPEYVRYQLTIDGEQVEQAGVTCLIANISSLGVLGMKFPQTVKADDGLLDVFIIKDIPETILGSIGTVIDFSPLIDAIAHWQAREIFIEADSTQSIFVDGERHPVSSTPATIHIQPHSLRLIVPHA